MLNNNSAAGLRLVAIFGTTFLLLILTVLFLRNQDASRARNSPSRPVPLNALADPNRAKINREFNAKHGDLVLARMEEKARTDPVYRQALLAMTRESIWKMESLSLEEKEEVWERTRKAQSRITSTDPLGGAK